MAIVVSLDPDGGVSSSRTPADPAARAETDGPETNLVGAVQDETEPGPASHLEELAPQGPNAVVAPGRSVFEEPTFIGPPPNRIAALPRWARIAIPAVLVLVIVAVLLAVTGGGGGDGRSAVSIDGAVAVAQERIDAPIPKAKVRSMVEQLCGAAHSGTSSSVVILAKQLPVETRASLRSTLNAMAAGAQQRCPNAEVDWDGLVGEVYTNAAPTFDA